MRPKKSVLILLMLVAGSCGRQSKMQRDQQNFDVVQEGSSTAASAPLTDQTAPPPPTTSAITNTNADTTTAFTLPQTATATTTAPPGTIAGSLPTSTGGSISGYTPPRPPRPRVVERPPSNPPMNSGTTTVAPPQTEGPPTPENVNHAPANYVQVTNH